MIANADAGLNWLTRAVPDLEEAKAAFTHISADGHHAGAVIAGIRSMFKKDVRARTALDVNEIIRGVLAAVRDELERHRVSVQVELTESLPWVNGDRVQLQQVLLNLTTNAIEAMATTDGARALGVTSEIHASGEVMVSVKDTGTGVAPEDVDRIFTPLFTTKGHGMGMGFRSGARSSRLTTAACGPCRTLPAAASFTSSYRPTALWWPAVRRRTTLPIRLRRHRVGEVRRSCRSRWLWTRWSSVRASTASTPCPKAGTKVSGALRAVRSREGLCPPVPSC